MFRFFHSNQPSMSGDRNASRLLIFAMAIIFFGLPLLGLLDSKTSSNGIPAVYLYFFIIWAIIILLTFLINLRNR